MARTKPGGGPRRLMLVSVLAVVGGIILLLAAAEAVVRAGAALGRRIGLSPLWIGLTVVAIGTSAPELVVSVEAAASGLGEVALGNVMGSNVLNILVVLGITALVKPVMVSVRTSREDMPLLLVISIGVAAAAWAGRLDVFTGIALVTIAAAYTFYLSRRERVTIDAGEDVEAWQHWPGLALAAAIAFSILGLVVGGRLVLAGATDVATTLGVAPRVIGLTVVALGTSLPELAVSLTAVRRGRVDLAIGNVVGSNMLNTTFILGSAAIAGPLPVEAATLGLDLPIMLLATALLWLFSFHDKRVNRWEAVVFLGLYVGYVVMLLR